MKKKLLISFAAMFIVLTAFVVYKNHVPNKTLKKAYLRTQIGRLGKQVLELEKEGKKTVAARQILTEASWLVRKTRDFKRVSERIQALRSALNDPALFEAADEQSPEDGSWGKWYTEWFWKLVVSYDHIADLDDQGQVPQYPVRFLDRINSPDRFLAYFNGLLISELDRDGIDHRRELNETLSVLMRMILRQQPKNYAFHPQLKEALMDFLMNQARDPETGYWGAWYKSGDRIKKTADLSITFHIVSYLKGEVPDWPKIIDTTLAIKDQQYPLGWIESGGYVNHHNMDVVELFRLGWPHATPAQQQAMRTEIRKMLDWCLKSSLQLDGSFRRTTADDDSLEESIYFGTSFLVRIGYFDPHRFWTQEEFPEAAEAKQHIVQFIRKHFDSGGAGGFYYQSALKQLGENPN
jgi:hypothetical protein